MRPVRKRYLIAVEGDGERSFAKFIDECGKSLGLPIHLDICNVRGGGYQKMLSEAIKQRDQKGSGKKNILVVDTDRFERREDVWTIEKLKEQCKKENFELIVQNPNLEGVFARMFVGNEGRNFISSQDAERELKKKWPDYNKPQDAMKLRQKFFLEDLLRMAKNDEHMKRMLEILGFKLVESKSK